MKKKNKLRYVIQLICFIFVPELFSVAFSAVKYIFSQISDGKVIEATSMIITLVALCSVTIIFGRVFCGYCCAFGSLGDFIRLIYIWVCKKMKKRPVKISEKAGDYLKYVKYFILAFIILSCYFGIYSKLKGSSPWDVFSKIRALDFALSGYLVGGLLLLLILILMAVEERAFCRFLCPMGAIFSILPVLPIFSLTRNREACLKNCKACKIHCPANISITDNGKVDQLGECFMCGKCMLGCPKKNINIRLVYFINKRTKFN